MQTKYFNFNRHLDGDDVIIEICQETISKISGKGRFANGDKDPTSPTASVSAHSMQSV
jgi:exocyst complex component 8